VRKAVILCLALVFGLALVAMPGTAMAQCSASKATASTTVKASCNHPNMSAEELAKHCNYEGKCEVAHINVQGMTCTGCENALTATLEKTDGVVKVLSVSHKDGTAIVCFDPDKVQNEMLVKTVANKGYKAQLATGTVEAGTATAKGEVKAASSCAKSCAKTCGTKSSCASKATITAVKIKTDEGK
jgi:copper chaperone CopZ